MSPHWSFVFYCAFEQNQEVIFEYLNSVTKTDQRNLKWDIFILFGVI